MQSPSNKHNDDLTLRNAPNVYLLVLEEGGYKLSPDALKGHADSEDLKRKRFAGKV